MTQWDSATQILIQDPQLKDIPVCRDFEYYINLNSQSHAELGTKLHPYKDLDSAFSEIMNFHSHNDRNVTVYVMEGTTVFANSVTYIVNITSVNIEAYNDIQSGVGLARMVGLMNSTKALSPPMPTKFNILGKFHL